MRCSECGCASDTLDFGMCADCSRDANAFIAPYAAINYALAARDEVIAAAFRKAVLARWRALRAPKVAS